MGKLILVLGGARSGKSTFAEIVAQELGGNQVVYLATAAAKDEEMRKRIELHQKSRPQEWTTVEETTNIAKVILERGQNSKVILLDCLTLLISNLLLNEDFGTEGEKEGAILEEIKQIALNTREVSADVIIVSNEVGLGLVPSYSLGREYRDIVGRANQLLASLADQVYFTIAGIPIELKELQKKLGENLNG